MKLIADVLLPLKLDRTFYYAIQQGEVIKEGQLVAVDFHNRAYIGAVLAVHNVDDILQEKDKPLPELKSITRKYDLPLLSKEFLAFIKWVASYTITPMGLILKMVLSVKLNHCTLARQIEKAQAENGQGLNDEKSHKAFSVELSSAQQEVAQPLIAKIAQGFDVTVLEGVTGSGKTEVYLKAIEAAIAQGGQALVLLPEIVLTSQLIERFTQRFGFRPLEWHSSLSVKQRRMNWLNVISGRAQFIVGARSALFLPFTNLQLIVVDEEHDSSFKQEEGVIYNARDMAVVRAKLEKFPLILSSATPSLETVHNAMMHKYNTFHLPSRYGEAVLPEVEAVDLSKDIPKKGENLAAATQHALLATYAAGKQSMLFLNRRGYAPVTLCGSCHTKIGCPNCNAWLVEHRRNKKLICHLCGYQMSLISECPNCHDTQKITSVGIGVEKLVEEVQQLMPMARIGLLSSDTMLNRKLVSEILSAITNGEIDVIIGTQMIAKGLHFPELHLVVIVDADAGYAVGDVRVLERTFQLFYQVAGRAGRSKQRGKVLIQTHDPQANVIRSMQDNDKKGFIDRELQDRQQAIMPPFSSLALITFSGLNEHDCLLYAKKIASIATESTNMRVLGPAPAPLFFVRKRYRYRILVKSTHKASVQAHIKDWLSKIKLPSSVRVAVDIDPYNFS